MQHLHSAGNTPVLLFANRDRIPRQSQWNTLTLAELLQAQALMGTTTLVMEINGGIGFYEGDMQIHQLHQSRLFGSQESTCSLIQHTADWTQVLVRYRRRFTPSADPSAFIVIYTVTTQLDGEAMIGTTDGKRILQTFICEYLFPRLRARTDDYEDKDEDMDFTAMCISQSLSYLQLVYTWLNHFPGHSWTHGTLEPSAILYMSQDDPEVQL
jgi:hypothetical protein